MTNPVTVEKFAVGQSVRRLEDPRLVQGLGRYSDDVSLTHQAYAAIVRSPHAHARILSIGTSAAQTAPGVLAVLTGADLAADGVGNLPVDGTRKRRDGSPAFRPLTATSTTSASGPAACRRTTLRARWSAKPSRRYLRCSSKRYATAIGSGSRTRASTRRR